MSGYQDSATIGKATKLDEESARVEHYELVASAAAYPKLLSLLRDCRLRISNMDPLARRLDEVLYPNLRSRHDECEHMLSESAYQILKAMNL